MSRFPEEVEMRGFCELVGDAFSYPLRGTSKWLLVMGAVFLYVTSWFTWVPIAGWLLWGLITGYLCAFMVSIVSHSAMGDPDLPGWPDVTDLFEDVVYPLLLVAGVMALCLLPAIVLVLGHVWSGWNTLTACYIALAAGLLYLPMALLGVCVNETFGMASPHIVVPAIFRVPLEYALACAALGAVIVLQVLAAEKIFDRLPILGGLLAQYLSLYCLVLQMRILGVLYYTRQRRLGWFT